VTGLPGAGKTSFAHVLATGSFDPATLPSRAHTYDMTTITKEGFALKVWDVARGGAFQTRWERYCRNCRAVVFVFDASDRDVSHITDAREALHDLMRRSTLHNVPLLVLGNKSDRKNAMTAGECADALRLDDVRDDGRGARDSLRPPTPRCFQSPPSTPFDSDRRLSIPPRDDPPSVSRRRGVRVRVLRAPRRARLRDGLARARGDAEGDARVNERKSERAKERKSDATTTTTTTTRDVRYAYSTTNLLN
jgi:ADP-ribosylation factor-like protein 8